MPTLVGPSLQPLRPPLHHRAGQLVLGQRPKGWVCSLGGDGYERIGLGPEAFSALNIVHQHGIQAFFLQLGHGMFQVVLAFGGESGQVLTRTSVSGPSPFFTFSVDGLSGF